MSAGAASRSRSSTTWRSTVPARTFAYTRSTASFQPTATIELSSDDVTFVSAGDFPDDANDVEIDLGALGLDFAVAVRITQAAGAVPEGEPGGFDLDAVEALNQIDLIDLTLSLLPSSASNLVGDGHTATATVTVDGSPVAGALVSFLVTSGPNTGDTDTATSDASGEAGFSYTGDGGAGSDAITAWLDLDGDGAVDADEPQATAAKDWLALGDLGIAAAPSSDSNPVGTAHTVTATLSPAFDGVSVRFRVVAGPNGGDEATIATSGGGIASFTYTGDGAPGVDAITAWIDVDGEGDIDAGEPQHTVTKTWTAVTVTTVSLSPTPDTNPIGTSHTVTATLSPATANAIVRFEVVVGPHSGATDMDTTDGSGQATFTYAGTTVGTDVIVAWFDEDNDAVLDADEPQALGLKTWTSQGVTSISLNPASDTNPIGSTHTLTATVSPTTSGALVRFRVSSGPNAGVSGSDTTDGLGKATFSYSSAVVGTDVIEAWVDTINNGVRDASELQTAAIKTWTSSGTATSLALTPAADTNFIGSSHTLTATITPQISGVFAGAGVPTRRRRRPQPLRLRLRPARRAWRELRRLPRAGARGLPPARRARAPGPDRQREGLHRRPQLPRRRRCRRRAAVAHAALPPADERQSRAFHPDPAERVGLRPPLPLQRRAAAPAPTLALPLQSPPTARRPRRGRPRLAPVNNVSGKYS